MSNSDGSKSDTSPISQFKMEFDRDQDAYEPGAAVGGNVFLNFTKPVEITGIFIRFSGHLRVNLEKTREKDPDFEGGYHKQLFEDSMVLFGTNNPEETVTHPEGYKEHKFFYPLPTDLPSSFEGDHGCVRYICDVIIQGGELQNKPYALTGVFTVYRKLDLNKEPRSIRRTDQQEELVVLSSCTGSGNVQVVFRLERLGFVPLDDVSFYIQVRNGSSTTLRAMRVLIKQIVTYDVTSLEGYPRSDGASATKQETTSLLNSVTKRKIKKKSHTEWMDCPLIVPLVPPSRMEGCDCIDIKYVLEFELETTGKSSSLKLARDITIGTVALTDDSLNDRTKSTAEDLEYMAALDKLRRSRRQTLMSQRGSLHFIMHPAYEIPDGAFISHAPESFRI